MPSHGMTITKITHSVLPPPPRSVLRKMSPRTQKRHMNHAKNRKNSNKARRNEPLSLNMARPFKRGPRRGSHRPIAAALRDHRQKASPDLDEKPRARGPRPGGVVVSSNSAPSTRQCI